MACTFALLRHLCWASGPGSQCWLILGGTVCVISLVKQTKENMFVPQSVSRRNGSKLGVAWCVSLVRAQSFHRSVALYLTSSLFAVTHVPKARESDRKQGWALTMFACKLFHQLETILRSSCKHYRENRELNLLQTDESGVLRLRRLAKHFEVPFYEYALMLNKSVLHRGSWRSVWPMPPPLSSKIENME